MSDAFQAWSHSVCGDFKDREFNVISGDSELLKFEGDSMSAIDVQQIGYLEEAFFYLPTSPSVLWCHSNPCRVYL